ncbi:MAG: hypothetical protein H0W90_03400 [Actinobacteria bacterium]|nr:hypothetical protein [Actinomycetota bacterium]
MRIPERRDDLVLPLDREDGLEAQFRHTFLAAGFSRRRLRALAAEECSRTLRVPGAALVVADLTCARFEERVSDGVERLAWDEDDELPVQISVSICAFCSLPL